MGRVFISYRRQETGHVAGRLADRLRERLGSTQLLTDVDAIGPGVDFAQAIATAVASCGVLIVLIGPTWTTVVNRRGRRQLDDPDDFVVLEIAAALERGIRVVPVLVDGAPMPRRDELPRALHELSSRQAVRLGHESFQRDVEPLLLDIQRHLGERQDPRPRGVDPRPPPRRPGPPDDGVCAVPSTALPAEPPPPTSAPAPPSRPFGLTAADVHNVEFSRSPFGKSGYHEDEVDAFLHLVEAALALTDPQASSLSVPDVHNVAFSKPPFGRRGYNEDEVDAFLDVVEKEMIARGFPR